MDARVEPAHDGGGAPGSLRPSAILIETSTISPDLGRAYCGAEEAEAEQ